MTDTPAAPTPPPPQHTLLCVDDEPNIVSALRRLFRGPGYRVLVADGGRAGLAVLEAEPVDLVISDMRMPEMTGAEFLAVVAERWPRTMRILLTGYADLSSTVDAINKGAIYRYVSKPWDDNDLKLTVQRALEQQHVTRERDRLVGIVARQNKQLRAMNAGLESQVRARTEEIRQTAEMLDLAYKELKQSYVEVVPVLASFAEMREGDSKGHGRRVAEMAREVARELRLEDDLVQQIYFAALLHDVGKLSMPDELLRKPFTAMKPEERLRYMRHPAIGQAGFTGVESMQDMALLIRCHHERHDGAGYPDGLQGDGIPLGARILAIANDFDSLQLGQLVEGQLGKREARAFLEENRGLRYDPRILDVFLAWLDSNPELAAGTIKEFRLTSDALKRGMVLARDFVNDDGVLMLSHGHVLDDRVIERLRAMERDEQHGFTVYVKHTE
ncbi:MAG: response regulator [Gammaproteobacteria bacterium]|nr:response regulator [Gammaproteobacteria bacterium]